MHRKEDFRSGPCTAGPERRREGRTRHMVDAFCSSLAKVFLCVCVCEEGIFGVLLASADVWAATQRHFAKLPGKWQIRQFRGAPHQKPEPVVGAPQPEQEVQLQQADAKHDRSKAELHEAQAKAKHELKEAEAKLEKAKHELKEAEAKLKEAEAKLKEAEAKLKEAKATGTEEDVGLARRKVDFALTGVASAQEGVASAQGGVASAQELVGAYTKQVSSLLKEPVAGPVAFSFPLVLSP
eukprot:g71577.t1